MKKLLLLALVLTNFMFVKAQNYAVLHIEDVPGGPNYPEYNFCAEEHNGVIIYAQPGCQYNEWIVDYTNHYQNVDSIVLDNNEEGYYFVRYSGCGINRGLSIFFLPSEIDNPFSEYLVWKRQGESVILSTNLDGYNFLWSNGSNENQIEVSEPGVYSVTISDGICLNETFSVEVRDNVEITLATCDLETNHNMVTWPNTSAQAEYVGTVEIKRDGMVVGTVNYSDGQFIDNIGSDAASRTYTITAIGTDGNLCPITSYPKETIHMSYTLGMNNTIEIGWNTPTGYDLLGYNVCEWHENDGSLNVIDFVGASVTSYTCSQSQFDEGYIVVQGVEADKNAESRLLSNRSLDLVGLGENEATAFMVYPNPAKGRFTVEGSGTMTVMNTLGQTILTQEIDGKATMELPQGLYFVKLGETMRKVVVE